VVCLFIDYSNQQGFGNTEGNWNEYKKAGLKHWNLVWIVKGIFIKENSNIHM